jgi:hypothetical protein
MTIALKISSLIIWLVIGTSIFLVGVYLLLPWIFKKFVSPLFNASYKYSASDFKSDNFKKTLSKQLNNPSLKVNKNTGYFEITFGKERKLTEGYIKLFSGSVQCSNEKSLSKKISPLILKNYTEEESEDILGKYLRISIKYVFKAQKIPLEIIFKQYFDKQFILFELKLPNGLQKTDRNNFGKVITSFPSFLNNSPNQKIFTYRHSIFCPPSRKINATSSPVIFYDNDLNCFILSPLDGFLNTIISEGKDSRINCGIQGEIENLPKNFTQRYILYFGKGINESMISLGDILLEFNNATRKSLYANVCTSYLGYWTDNGAFYYYKTKKGMNYEETLVAIKDYFDKHQIPIKYYNFDSWWYQKHTNKIFTTIFRPLVRLMGGGLYGNTIRWETDPNNFTTNLKIFHGDKFNIPITAHNRRWDARSPYTANFEFKIYNKNAIPLKLDFWNWLMNHAKKSGIVVYEQDWMKNQVDSIPYLRKNYEAKEKWLRNMAIAAKENGVDIFYCMETPGMLLYTIKHNNINISRCSGDYNHRWPLTYRFVDLTQTNILFNAIGINSHPDVFRSRSIEDGRLRSFGEKYPKLRCLIQILGAGLVCPGDKEDNVNWPLLKKTCRSDGLLLKPDRALTANDLMFKPHRKYYISDTYTAKNGLYWHYILITNIWPNRVKEQFITPNELGFTDEEYVLFDFNSRKIQRIKNKTEIDIGALKKYDYKYLILCPLSKNEISLIGSPDKFVTCSNKLYPSVAQEENEDKQIFLFEVENIGDANMEILLYSKKKPTQIYFKNDIPIDNKNVKNNWQYNNYTNLLRIFIHFSNKGKKQVKVLLD